MHMNRKQFLQSVGLVGAGAAMCGAWGRTASAGTIESHVEGLPGKMKDWQEKHCMMMENYSFMPFHITTLNMTRQGFFGEIVHGDGAYNTSKMGNNFSKTMYWNMWWLRMYGARKGNIYPTHGMGPIAQMMNINRGDRFDFLVSVESKDFMMADNAKALAAKDGFRRG